MTRRFCARVLRDRRAGVGLLFAAALPVIIGMAAFAVDLGAVQLDTRRLQGVADAAALAAASGDPTNAQTAVQAAIVAAGYPQSVAAQVTPGNYAQDESIAPSARFTPLTNGTGNAARVVLQSTSPTFFARIFGKTNVVISRQATAAQQRYAAFSIGSRLASLNGGILNSYLSALTGSNVSLSVMDYQSLVGADVDLFKFLPLLRTSAGLNALTFGDVLNSNVSTPQVLNAVASALSADGQPAAATAIKNLLNVSGGQSLTLSALIDAGPFATQSEGGTGLAKVNALAMATAVLQLASQQRQVALDLGATLPGLASTKVFLAVGQRQAQSPWITITAAGTPIIHTAQTRLFIQTQLAPTLLPGLSGLISINLPIFVQLAGAEGKLDNINCAGGTTPSVTLDARTDAVQAAIGDVNTAALNDFSTPIAPTPTKLVHSLLVDVIGSSNISTGAAEPWQQLTFGLPMIQAGQSQTISQTVPVSGLATSLIQQATLTPSLLGGLITLPLAPLLQSVGGALQIVSPVLDSLLMTVTGALGVGIGQADLRVTGMRCGAAVLVA
ncbi:MAG: hypothetical protein J0I25_07590 [Sphingomonadales bacterium]|nr:hypothetical protein [Sphingomonadales bacterium]